MLGDVPIPRKGITEVFIHFTRQVELAQFGKVQGRGFYNPILDTSRYANLLCQMVWACHGHLGSDSEAPFSSARPSPPQGFVGGGR